MYNFNISMILIHLLENGKAGWKFWKKDKETTTTTTSTTSTSISVEAITIPTKATTIKGPTVPTVNTRTTSGATNSELAIDMDSTRQNVRNDARPNRLNLGTEVGLDIASSRLHRPGISGGNNQSYRDWAMELTGAGESVRNQPSRIPVQGLATNGDGQTQPNLPAGHYFILAKLFF